jgi:hypothetical protein
MIKLHDNDDTAIAPNTLTLVQRGKWTKNFERHSQECPSIRIIIDGHDVVLFYYSETKRDADYAMLTGPVDAK